MPRVQQTASVHTWAPITTVATRDVDDCIVETVSSYGLFQYTCSLTLNPDKTVASASHLVEDL